MIRRKRKLSGSGSWRTMYGKESEEEEKIVH